MVFAGYSGFLHYLQLASHELATIGINVTKNKIQIQIQIHGNLLDHIYASILSRDLLCIHHDTLSVQDSHCMNV